MGNCQAAEVATVVIQHPGGRVERLYWPTSAADVMKSNPGYHVALVTLYVSETKTDGGGGGAGTVRFTRVRLLKPRDMLLLGQVYRLITSQGSIRTASLPFPDSLLGSLISDSLPEVAKALRQRKYEKLKKNQAESIRKQQQQQQHGTNDQCTDQNMHANVVYISFPSIFWINSRSNLVEFVAKKSQEQGEQTGDAESWLMKHDGVERPLF